MAVSAVTPSVQYTGNASTKDFGFTFVVPALAGGGSITNGTGEANDGDQTLTVTTADFFYTSDLVGKAITITGAGESSATLSTTILSRTSGTVVELVDAASQDVTGQTVTVTTGTYATTMKDTGDLEVYVDGTLQSYTTHYTVLLNVGDDSNKQGTVQFVTAPADTTTITILRDVALSRTTDFQSGGALTSKTLNAEFDNIVMAVQDTVETSVSSALKFPASELVSTADSTLPSKTSRVSSILSFDSSGDLNVTNSPTAVTMTATTFVGALTGAVTGTVSSISNHDTDDLSEGSSNLYFTNERVDDRVDALVTDGDGITTTYDDSAGTLTIAGEKATTSNRGIAQYDSNHFTVTADATVSIKDDGVDATLIDFGTGTNQVNTDDLHEGSSNLYYTDARVLTKMNATSVGALSDVVTTGTGPSSGAGTVLAWSTSNERFEPTASTISVSATDPLNYDSGTGALTLLANGVDNTHIDWGSGAGQVDTDDVPEGSSNVYFTNARSRSSISVSGDLSYNSSTGVMSTSGLASSTTDNLAEGSTNLYYTNARVQAISINNVAEDTTPQLGGSLDVNGQSIVSVSAGDIAITPHTTGDIILDGLKWPQADGSGDQLLKTDGNAQLTWATIGTGGLGNLSEDTTPQLGGEVDVQTFGRFYSTASGRNIELDPHSSASLILKDMSWPNQDTSSVGDILTVASSGTALEYTDLDTDDVDEGSTNLFYTNARADARITNAGSANWNTAYGWGNHASGGYISDSDFTVATEKPIFSYQSDWGQSLFWSQVGSYDGPWTIAHTDQFFGLNLLHKSARNDLGGYRTTAASGWDNDATNMIRFFRVGADGADPYSEGNDMPVADSVIGGIEAHGWLSTEDGGGTSTTSLGDAAVKFITTEDFDYAISGITKTVNHGTKIDFEATPTGAQSYTSGGTGKGRIVSLTVHGDKIEAHTPVELEGYATGSLPTASSSEAMLVYDTDDNEVKFSNGSSWQGLGTSDIVGDTTPQLGGDLDSNGNDIQLNSGHLFINDSYGIKDLSGGSLIVNFDTTPSAVNWLQILNATTGNGVEQKAVGTDTDVDFIITPKGAGKVKIDNHYWPNADGSDGQVLKTNASGVLSWTANTGDIVSDTTPQLGGDLDVNGETITSTSNGNILITPDATGATGNNGANPSSPGGWGGGTTHIKGPLSISGDDTVRDELLYNNGIQIYTRGGDWPTVALQSKSTSNFANVWFTRSGADNADGFLTEGKTIGGLYCSAYDDDSLGWGVDYNNVTGSFFAKADENHSKTELGTRIEFFGTPNGSVNKNLSLTIAGKRVVANRAFAAATGTSYGALYSGSDGIPGTVTFGTFSSSDTTPSVSDGNLWKTHASTQSITMFDDGIAGQFLTIISTAAVTYDVTSTNLKGGSNDIVTADGDVTTWVFDGTNWYMTSFIDNSADLRSGV